MKKGILRMLFMLALCTAIVFSLASCDKKSKQEKLEEINAEYVAQIAELEAKIDELEDQKSATLDKVAELEAKIDELESQQNPPSSSATYTVTFDAAGGSAVAAQTVAHGEKISVPADPEKTGYVFGGWYAGEEKWSFVGYGVTENVSLTASWIPRSYSITYVTNGGNSVTQNVNNFNITQLPLTFTPDDTHKNDHRFDGWFADAEFTVPFTSITEIGDTSIYAKFTEGAPGLEYTNNVIYCSVSGYTGDSTTVIIPDYHNNNPITGIGEFAFSGCSDLTSISIPDTVTSIGYNAFSYCSGLTSVTIPDSVASIGDSAFYACSSLMSITVPKGITSIGTLAFYNCESLEAVYIADIAKWCAIGFGSDTANPLYYANKLYLNGELLQGNIVIPDGVTGIGSYVFTKYSHLTSITIPDSVTSIGDGAFYKCSSLVNITIPDDVTSIGGRAFYACTGLESITIPNSVTHIGLSAFSDCSGLTIYAEAPAKPSGWASNWNPSNQTVIWGYTE